MTSAGPLGDGHAAGREARRSHVGAEVVALLLAAAVVIFLIVNRRDVPDAFAAVREARLGWLALALLASAAFVTAYGMARRASMLAFDVHLAPRRAVLTGAIAQGLNIVTKSGGMAGAAVYRDEARRAHHSPALVLGGTCSPWCWVISRSRSRCSPRSCC